MHEFGANPNSSQSSQDAMPAKCPSVPPISLTRFESVLAVRKHPLALSCRATDIAVDVLRDSVSSENACVCKSNLPPKQLATLNSVGGLRA